MRYLIVLSVCSVLLLARNEYALARNEYADQTRGSGLVVRTASVLYNADITKVDDASVDDLVLLMYYEDEHFFMHGLTYGIKLYNYDDWQFSLIGRARFLDIPESLQNKSGGTVDCGLRTRHFLNNYHYVDLEVLENVGTSTHVNLTYSANLQYGKAWLEPYTTLRFKDSAFNTEQYGLKKETIDSGLDLSIGLKLKYHLWSKLYFMGSVSFTYLGSEVSNSDVICDDYAYNASAGIGILNDQNSPEFFHTKGMKPYIRLAYGWATPSNLSEILAFDWESDSYDNQFTSVSYGHPAFSTLFTLPIEVYLTPGFVFHHDSDVQNSTQEFVIAFKFYYTLPLPCLDIRLGVGEGISYVMDVTYIEQAEMDRKGYESNRTMLYLDFSADINLGFIDESLQDLFAGVSIHHRSAFFEKSAFFGRIKGGSNYNSVYLQWHF